MSNVTSLPAANPTGGIDRTASGARFARSTVTPTFWTALSPAGSRAVTVTVALPSASPAIVSLEPDTDAVATEASELSAV